MVGLRVTFAFACALALLACASPAAAAKHRASKPNVVVITSDDQTLESFNADGDAADREEARRPRHELLAGDRLDPAVLPGPRPPS